MKTKTIKLYQFDEITDAKLKQKILNNYRDINVDSDAWHDFDGLTGFSVQECNLYGIDIEHSTDLLEYDHDKMTFDIGQGGYIQFRGCIFTHRETARKFLKIPVELWERLDIGFIHAGKMNTEIMFDADNLTQEDNDILDKAYDRFDYFMRRCLKDLRQAYEDAQTDEAVIDTLVANEYYFNEQGKIENP